jgi:hypothetical protein
LSPGPPTALPFAAVAHAPRSTSSMPSIPARKVCWVRSRRTVTVLKLAGRAAPEHLVLKVIQSAGRSAATTLLLPAQTRPTLVASACVGSSRAAANATASASFCTSRLVWAAKPVSIAIAANPRTIVKVPTAMTKIWPASSRLTHLATLRIAFIQVSYSLLKRGVWC